MNIISVTEVSNACLSSHPIHRHGTPMGTSGESHRRTGEVFEGIMSYIIRLSVNVGVTEVIQTNQDWMSLDNDSPAEIREKIMDTAKAACKRFPDEPDHG